MSKATDSTQFETKRTINWQPIREAYVQRSPKPTYTELSKEYAVSISRISEVSSEEVWDNLRAGFAEQRLKEAGASELVLRAIQNEGVILNGARDIAAKVLIGLRVILEELGDADKAPKSLGARADIINTVTFALANMGKFLESLGLVGMHKELRKVRREGEQNGSGWEAGVMQQINVTVQNLQSQAKAAESEKVVEESA